MIENETIKQQLNHKSIRSFTDKKLSSDKVDTLIKVAQHTATSSFMQAYSIIGVTDEEKKATLAEIAKQPYVAQASHVFVMIVDQSRNQQIASENGVDASVVSNMDRFMAGYADAILAAQNIVVAAESLALGTVFLGSLLNDAPRLIELLKLPKYTFPVLGIAIGYPNQEPQLKPRLPKEFVYSENEYPVRENLVQTLKDYDKEVTTYYDLRAANRRVDSFTNQVTNGMKHQNPVRAQLLQQIKEQKLIEK